jgi:hypothetical protein
LLVPDLHGKCRNRCRSRARRSPARGRKQGSYALALGRSPSATPAPARTSASCARLGSRRSLDMRGPVWEHVGLDVQKARETDIFEAWVGKN